MAADGEEGDGDGDGELRRVVGTHGGGDGDGNGDGDGGPDLATPEVDPPPSPKADLVWGELAATASSITG